ncbi:hypothetical protein ACQP3F_32990, partial [Escherichia coli]
ENFMLVFILAAQTYIPSVVNNLPFVPHPHQRFLSFIFLIAILTELRENLYVVLICISMMVKDVEHFPNIFLLST